VENFLGWENVIWLVAIVSTAGVGIFCGRHLDRSYDLAKFCGVGIRGYWVLWIIIFVFVFGIYAYHGSWSLFIAIFMGAIFHQNHKYMRNTRLKEGLKSEISSLANDNLKNNLSEVIKEPIAKIVGDKAHDKRLKQVIKSAQETVVILSGLDVEKVETQEFRTALERCLKRGVMVYIGYGYQKTKLVEGDVNATETAKETLDDLMGWYLKRKLEGRLEVYFYPTHSTALIKDDEYAIIGNYDWLSVKNDKTDQKGWYISNSKFVAAERDKIVMAQ